ncbi:transcriptional regulator [Rhizobium leguminosarum bv. viciae]|uniref:helix-turn-helix domain-containing protein n=1 Tax=Rhizobium leguminosarum TaxID=384 RepID=UPI0014426C67|nr:helix-turn-helix transcriptional regulator [Rhizobium leguminosarum]NKL02985.1 transcriptional regulator [Rhizobium leguminosarum bv. viciae]
MKVLASQFRAARALLELDQEAVAAWIKLDQQEISRWEGAKYKLLSVDGVNLRNAFKANGIEFIAGSDDEGAGVRFSKPGAEDHTKRSQFRAARALANLTIRNLEQVSGVNRNFIFRLEAGKIGGINLDKIRKLEEAFLRLNVRLTERGEKWGVGARWSVPDPFPDL